MGSCPRLLDSPPLFIFHPFSSLPAYLSLSSELTQSAVSHVTSSPTLTEHARASLCCQAKIRQQKEQRSAIDKHTTHRHRAGEPCEGRTNRKAAGTFSASSALISSFSRNIFLCVFLSVIFVFWRKDFPW